MVKLSANLSLMFNEVDFLDRFEAAARAGFNGVEYLFPYDYPVGEIQERLQKNNLTQVLFDFPAGDFPAGDRGIACQPDRVGEFKDSVGKALEYAQTLGCSRLTCLAGIAPEGVDRDKLWQTFVDNLKFAAPEAAKIGANVLVEAINTRDMPGYFLNHTADAKRLVDEVGADNVRIQYDVYHMQIMEGDLTPTIEKHFSQIHHYQIADNPGRHEPGTGEINYPFVLDFIDRLGYDGWVGCEYRPAGKTQDGLTWAKAYLG